MLDDRGVRYFPDSGFPAREIGDFKIGEREDANEEVVLREKKTVSLGEEGLKKWCVGGYFDPRTGRRIYGKDVLLSAFYNKEGFWIELFRYVESLPKETVLAIGGRIPGDRGSFAYRIKKAGYPKISPKNVCVWLGAIDDERAELVDDIGNLSAEGLVKWCHEGYENESGKRVYGKDVLISAAESGNFWNEIESYAERLSLVSIKSAGGRFPRFPRMLSERLLDDGSEGITIANVFAKLGVPMPKTERVRQSSKGFLSWAELRDWCHKGYRNGIAGQRIFWKHVLLDALYSGTFWKEFERYAKSLGKIDLAEIGWPIPCTQTGYESRVTETWLVPGAKGTCLWFGALDAETSDLCDESGFLSAQWLKKWFEEWYLADDGKTVTGKDVLSWCANTRSFWNSLEKYAAGISVAERRKMGGRFPKHAKSIGERTVGYETSVSDLLEWFGMPASINPTDFSGPKASPLPLGLSPAVKGRIRSFIRKVLELGDPDRKNPLWTAAFSVRETPNEILVTCGSRRIASKLREYRTYVDETLSYEASADSEKSVAFDWKG